MAKASNESNFEVIKRHLFFDESIALTDIQQRLLQRWNYVMELRSCQNLRTKDIVQKLMQEHEIERATAMSDIAWAEALYGFSNTLNKRYRIGARIEFLEQYIDELREAKEHIAAGIQEKNLAKLYELYPENKNNATPREFRFVYHPDKNDAEDLPTIEDAEFTLQKELNNG